MLLIFLFSDWFFRTTNVLRFDKIYVSCFFSLIDWAFGVLYRNTCPTQGNKEFLLSFLLELLIILVLIFRFSIDFVFISVSCEVWVKVYVCHVVLQFYQNYLLKRLSFPSSVVLAALSKRN